ncbi:MAG: hypothetical protein KKI12_05365 [Proteobacteria bacterium]|nr:hypothetical protein [Pseudomonadota bacterium]MBU4287586.1 hypothetical protein [Pseudomonadota bacterium]MCG2831511.1 hypothetical protein [Desulfobacteraceae bacterium]
MTNLEYLAKDLHMEPEALLRASLETFLKRKLKVIESELFLLARKYGVSSVVEFDKMVKEGKLHEEDSFEDYFKFDNLEAEKERILNHLEQL